MNKIRLLCVHDSFDYRGGGEQKLLHVASLAREFFDVDLALLWAGDNGVLTASEASQFGTIDLLQFPHRVSPGTFGEQRGRMGSFRELLHGRDYDAAIAFSLRSAVRLASAAGPSLPTAWMCQQSFPLFEPPLRSLKEFAGVRALRRAGTRVVCIAEEAVRELIGRGIAAENLSLIRNGVDFAHYAEATAAPPVKGALSVVCVARQDPIKNHGVLLRGVAEARHRGADVRLCCVGGEAPHHLGWARELRSLADELGLADVVEWAGEQGDVRPFLGRANVFVLPSRKEAMGLVLAEAGAAGLALVGSRVGGIPEVIEHGESGLLFADNDAEELAMTLVKLSDRPDLVASMGEAAKQRSGQLFNNTRQDNLWRAFLRELSPQPTAGPSIQHKEVG